MSYHLVSRPQRPPPEYPHIGLTLNALSRFTHESAQIVSNKLSIKRLSVVLQRLGFLF